MNCKCVALCRPMQFCDEMLENYFKYYFKNLLTSNRNKNTTAPTVQFISIKTFELHYLKILIMHPLHIIAKGLQLKRIIYL